MIASLTGILQTVRGDSLVLDVNGVGYLVYCASNFLSRLPVTGSPLSLHIETQVREDAIILFGFEQEMEREWFRLLMTVQGVGAKLALAILGNLGVDGVARASALQDKQAFARTSGVGPKLAGRIANDLKDKAPAMTAAVNRGSKAPSLAAAPVTDAAQAAYADALSALVNLGYKEADAAAALTRARHASDTDAAPETRVGELVRNGLRELL